MENIIKAPEGYKFEKLDNNTIKLVTDRRLHLLNQLNGKDWFYIKYLDIHDFTIQLLTNNSNLFKIDNIGYRWFFIDKNAIHKNNKSILRFKKEENKYNEYIAASYIIDFSDKIKQIIDIRFATDAEINEMYLYHPKLRPIEKWQDMLLQPNLDNNTKIYYHITGNRFDNLKTEFSHCYKSCLRKAEHAFSNKESAELVKDKMLLMQEMHAFAHAMNDGWLPNWNDYSQKKHGIIYERIFKIVLLYCYNSFTFGIAVKSEKIAEQMLKEFGEKLENYYHKQY